MKIWNWIKSIGWLTTTGALLAAILMVIAGRKAGRLNRRAENAERLAENIVQDHTKKHIDRAAKLQASAAKDKKAAAIAEAKVKSQLEKLGETEETIEDIANRFNTRKRLRS